MLALVEARIAIRNTESVEPTAQIAHEPMTLADDLRTWQRLEPAHRARPPFQMLVVPLNALLHYLPCDVFDLGQDCRE
jgi:hypothetical protein